MIISRKRYQREISEEVSKALNKANEERWMSERIENECRDRYKMFEEIDRRLKRLEKLNDVEDDCGACNIAVR